MFDGNGNWTSDFSAQADRDNGIKILASRFDNIFIADIKESFENCLTKDGQIAPIGNFNMGGQKITNVGTGVNDTDAVNKGQVDSAINTVLTSLYPVGSLYIGTQSTCPLASLISGSQWELVGKDHALWTTDGTNANTTIPAGLPNITGTIASSTYLGIFNSTNSGAFNPVSGWSWNNGNEGAGQSTCATAVNFSAASSNSIYGASSTVQPPAYRVNVWRRIA